MFQHRPDRPLARSLPLGSASFALLALLLPACAGSGVHARFSHGSSLELSDLRPTGRQDESTKPAAKVRPAKDGFYVAGLLARSDVPTSDLDGESVLVGGGGIILLPELDAGTGWGAALGWRTGQGSLEFNYVRTDHDASFLGASGDAQLCSFNMDWRWHFRPQSKLQPNLLIGLAVPSLVIEDGSSDGIDIGDGELLGIGANLGAGLDYQLTPGLAIISQAVYRFASLNSADGVGISGTLEDSLDISGLDLRIGLRMTL